MSTLADAGAPPLEVQLAEPMEGPQIRMRVRHAGESAITVVSADLWRDPLFTWRRFGLGRVRLLEAGIDAPPPESASRLWSKLIWSSAIAASKVCFEMTASESLDLRGS